MTLLEQLRAELPDGGRNHRAYLSADVVLAEGLAQRARELNIKAIRYLIRLDRLEPQPPENSRFRAAYDILVGALAEVTPVLATMPSIEVGSG